MGGYIPTMGVYSVTMGVYMGRSRNFRPNFRSLYPNYGHYPNYINFSKLAFTYPKQGIFFEEKKEFENFDFFMVKKLAEFQENTQKCQKRLIYPRARLISHFLFLLSN